MIVIIDYGMGNLRSVQKGLEQAGYEAIISSDPDEVVNGEGVILPGVGAFADAIDNLRRTGLDRAVFEVVKQQRPLLGVCLGLQLFFTESEENGLYEGLNLIKGRVVKLPPGNKIPHMGWNQMKIVGEPEIFKNIPDLSYFYFVHSYYCLPEEETTIGLCDYSLDFPCAVQKGSIIGTQFHPEKSSSVGLQILKNFGAICTGAGSKEGKADAR
ncbi:MAG: imidazole glycerol phosphate synthase subunit HisH [Chitinophagales bacterium]